MIDWEIQVLEEPRSWGIGLHIIVRPGNGKSIRCSWSTIEQRLREYTLPGTVLVEFYPPPRRIVAEMPWRHFYSIPIEIFDECDMHRNNY